MNHRVPIALLLSCLLLSPALAQDVGVRLEIGSADPSSINAASGVLTLEVINHSDGALRNVNLRPRFTGGLALAREVFQFGAMAPGGVGQRQEPYHAADPSWADGPSVWQLDYDAADGQHHRQTITLEHD